ncbi:MAG TPA: hypothetical protein VGN37_03645 [Actinocatenispora sp.]
MTVTIRQGLATRRVGVEVLRGLTAAGVLLSADIHLELWVTGFRDISVIGPLFLLNAIGGLVIAVVMLAWRHWLPAFAAAGFGAATLVAFLLSMTGGGLLGVHETLAGTPQRLAFAAEIVALVCGLALTAVEFRRWWSVRSGAGTRG